MNGEDDFPITNTERAIIDESIKVANKNLLLIMYAEMARLPRYIRLSNNGMIQVVELKR